MKRRHLYAANWKMNKTVAEAVLYFQEFTQLVHSNADIYIAPPFTALFPLAKLASNSPIAIGAQNMNDVLDGAYTGEISVKMLVEAGADFVILGHSERRRLFSEDNSLINRKIQLAMQNHLEVLLCIGETAEERFSGKTNQVIEKQLEECLLHVSESKLAIAYEPIWAIGNGHPATPSDAEDAHRFIRSWLEKRWKQESEEMRILYGGSVNAKNAADFLEEKNIDGLLVGTASLDPRSFSEIVNLG